MKLLCLLALLALPMTSAGGQFGDYQEEPKILLKIVSALEKSGFEELTSRKPEGENYSYHLGAAKFLGTVERSGKSYVIAYAFFLRSSPQGRGTPPARGHHFIVVLDPEWKIVGHGRVDMGEYYLLGTELHYLESKAGEEGQVIADFGSTKASVRNGGYSLLNMPYPFPDRISDADYEAGKFDEKDK
jgi:hypothetical protein